MSCTRLYANTMFVVVRCISKKLFNRKIACSTTNFCIELLNCSYDFKSR